jgi:TonB family protein
MKTYLGCIAAIMLLVLLAGCGENAKGPEKQGNPTSASSQSSQEVPPADFVNVDKEPTLLKRAEPVYPELAKKAGLEGKVWVKIWVDTEGRPKEVKIMKSDSDVFNQVTLDAAKQFLFTPAYINGKPVSVWVSVPFAYKLADKKPGNEGSQSVSKSGSTGEASFMKGYIAAKEEALAAMQKEAEAAQKNGRPNAGLEQKIKKSKAEIATLKNALQAMQEGR